MERYGGRKLERARDLEVGFKWVLTTILSSDFDLFEESLVVLFLQVFQNLREKRLGICGTLNLDYSRFFAF